MALSACKICYSESGKNVVKTSVILKLKRKCFAKRKRNTNVNQRASNVIVIETKLILQRKWLHKMFSKFWLLIASIWWFGDNWQHSIMTLASLAGVTLAVLALAPQWKVGNPPTRTLGIYVRRRCHNLLKQIAGSPSTDFRTGQRTCSCSCITGLGGTCFLCVWMAYSWTQKQTV